MNTESEVQEDLTLNTEDAENVSGGRMWKRRTQKKRQAHRAAGHSLPSINIQTPMSPSSSDYGSEDCDPGVDPGTPIPSEVKSDSGA